jgi:hypothetical protein
MTAMTPEAMRARLVQRLEENRGLAPRVADWAVDAWSYALGVDLSRTSDRVNTGDRPIIDASSRIQRSQPAPLPEIARESASSAEGTRSSQIGGNGRAPRARVGKGVMIAAAVVLVGCALGIVRHNSLFPDPFGGSAGSGSGQTGGGGPKPGPSDSTDRAGTKTGPADDHAGGGGKTGGDGKTDTTDTKSGGETKGGGTGRASVFGKGSQTAKRGATNATSGGAQVAQDDPSRGGKDSGASGSATGNEKEAQTDTHDTTPSVPSKHPLADVSRISVRIDQSISSESATVGQTVPATVAEAVLVKGEQVIARGAPATLRVVNVIRAGHWKGVPQVDFALVRVVAKRGPVVVRSATQNFNGKSRGKDTVKKTGIGAAVGSAIGGIFHKGKGAVEGAAVGAGAAVGYQALTNAEVTVPAETLMTFRLKAPGDFE